MGKSVVVVSTGLSNIDSIARALQECGAEVRVATAPDDLRGAAHVVLPGVGAFDDAMRRLTASGMADALRAEVVQAGRPFLGVCLGMQLMAEVGEEGIGACGLGFIGGRVERFVPVNGERIPHMGWNEVTSTNESPLFAGIPAASDFYFVHSYHLTRTTSDIAKTPYCGGFVSAVQRDHLFGVQFHPEKSQRAGFALLKNFLSVQ